MRAIEVIDEHRTGEGACELRAHEARHVVPMSPALIELDHVGEEEPPSHRVQSTEDQLIRLRVGGGVNGPDPPPREEVVDLPYPETATGRAARAAGATVVAGLEALVAQGAASFELWTGQPAPVEAMRAALGLPP